MESLSDFISRLTLEEDVNEFTVEAKLEYLVKTMPEDKRREYEPCFMNGFLVMGEAFYSSKEKEPLEIVIPFFSVSPQNLSVHELAHRRFMCIIEYGLHLGVLLRENHIRKECKNSLFRKAVEVYNGDLKIYDEIVKKEPVKYDALVELPNYSERRDLLEFFEWMKEAE